MGSNVILGIVIAIIVIAAIIYGVGFFIRKKNQERMDAVEKRKETLFDLPVIEEIDEVKKMHLVGQSQNTFREWNQKWTDVSTNSFADLESQIFEVENLNETFRFLKAKAAVEVAEGTMDQMETDVKKIRAGLKELRESEERNSLEVQKALDVYEELKVRLRDNSEDFGPALPEVQKQFKHVESEFTQFVTLNTSGDPVEARDVLEAAEKGTYALESLMDRIPKAYEDLNKTFPAQLKEIQDGYKQLIEEHFMFPEENFQDSIHRVERQVEATLQDLAKTEMDQVENANKEIADNIDELYKVMEREIDSKRYVVRNRHTLTEYVKHALKNNHQLMVELDHTAQSYTLNHNELARTRGFQNEIEELSRRNEAIEPKLNEHEIPYSEVEIFYKDAYKILDDVENQQLAIDGELRELRKDEKIAQDKVDEFEFKLRNLKRYVEKQRLPGLPSDYLEIFFGATDRIEDLSKALNKIRVDIEQVNKMVAVIEDDLKILDDKTTDLVDAAGLAEQMMQYANRYRHSHPEVKAAIDRSLELFTKEFRYQDALDEIGTALERVEPGAFKRIEDFFFNHRDLV